MTVNRQEVSLNWLPAGLDGLKVVHLTDFHYRPGDDDGVMEKLMERLAEEEPDLVVLTGDYVISSFDSFLPLVGMLAKLKAKHGVFVSMGNHDGWTAEEDAYRKAFESIGCTFFVNQHTVLTIGGERLVVAGLDYQWDGNPDAVKMLAGVKQDDPVLALVHEPDFFDELASMHPRVMQFSGHTHGGQCRVPLIGYAPVKVKYGQNYIKGLYEMGVAEGPQAKLFVSSGIGTVGVRVRFACPPEIAVLTLRRG